MTHIPKIEQQQTGPLTARQHQVMNALILGEMHDQIARRLPPRTLKDGTQMPVGRAAVSQDVRFATAKLKCKTSRQAVAKYSTYLAYNRAAEMLRSGKITTPYDDAEMHVNHVLEGMAAELTKRAVALLPQ